jgi:hypothetical protein
LAFYRVTSAGRGIYEAVEADCGREDARRAGKPDGSWLPRLGEQFPGAVSFWTEAGFARYRESGLAAWHASVVAAPVEVLCLDRLPEALYRDDLQVIVPPDELEARVEPGPPFFHLLLLLVSFGLLASSLASRFPASLHERLAGRWPFFARYLESNQAWSNQLSWAAGFVLAWGLLVTGRSLFAPASLRSERKRRARAAVLAAALSLCALLL